MDAPEGEMLTYREMQVSARIKLRDARSLVDDDWVLPEEPVPESSLHDLASDLLKLLLLAWVARLGRLALPHVGRNLGVHWDKDRPAIGVAPDILVLDPPPPEGELDLTSLQLWKEGHHPPVLAVEIVSSSRPAKDYVTSPERYAASGTQELWIFDPRLAGPKRDGGPHRLQIWRRGGEDSFERIYAGDGPAFSPAVSGWLFVVREGHLLRIADDEAGTRWWMTEAETERAAKKAECAAKEEALRMLEAERAAKEAERAAKEAERAAKEEALRRIAELEADRAANEGR
jgi:Uma2 family endonuclease